MREPPNFHEIVDFARTIGWLAVDMGTKAKRKHNGAHWQLQRPDGTYYAAYFHSEDDAWSMAHDIIIGCPED